MNRIIHQSCRALLHRFRCDVAGASGTEYAVLLGLVMAVVVVTVGTFGESVSGTTRAISHDLGAESGMTLVISTSAASPG